MLIPHLVQMHDSLSGMSFGISVLAVFICVKVGPKIICQMEKIKKNSILPHFLESCTQKSGRMYVIGFAHEYRAFLNWQKYQCKFPYVSVQHMH